MSHLTSILSRAVLCGTIAACILDSAAAVALRRRGTYGDMQHDHSTVMIGVMLVLLTLIVLIAMVWRRRSRRAKKSAPRHTWENLEKQSDTSQNEKETFQNETFQNVDLAEPAPAVHSKKRTTDTWDKYLSMIKSPTRLNSTVGKMSTMDKA